MKVTKRELKREIWASKLTYCQIIEPAYTTPDICVADLKEVTAPGLTIRVNTDEHLKRADVQGKGNHGHLDGEISFDPFILYRSFALPNGKIVFKETVRSHQRKGRLTNGMGILMMAMAESYARRGNWRGYTYVDEMVSAALVNLTLNVLKFNETKSDNPHAYITRCLQTSFIRELGIQKKQGEIKDSVAVMNGLTPSYSAQMAAEQGT